MKKEILATLKKQLMEKGFSSKKAEVIALRHLKKANVVDEKGELTPLGQTREALGAEGRAFSREGLPPEAGFYDKLENKIGRI